jgi:hypothetical protein
MYEGPPRLSVIRTRATSIDLPPATTRSAVAVTRPAWISSSSICLDGEAVREHDRLGAAVAGRGEQFERSAARAGGFVSGFNGPLGMSQFVVAVYLLTLGSIHEHQPRNQPSRLF